MTALSEGTKEEGLPSDYALSLSVLLARSDWPAACRRGRRYFGVDQSNRARSRKQTVDPPAVETDGMADLEALFGRLKTAKHHYEVLDVAALAYH